MERKEEVLRKFGKQVAAIRRQKQLSIPQLAIATGLRPGKLVRIEAGKVNLLFTSILALSKGLGISPDELLQSVI
jgi:transcriptional regulator with XRE-family HTH domain